MKYTREQMKEFYKIYDSKMFGNRSPFCDKLKEFGVPKEEAELIWYSFDLAVENTFRYVRSV